MASVTAIPATYAKFVTALAGVGISYLTAYGTTWNLQGALVAIGAALAVFGVPNASAPVAPTFTVSQQTGSSAIPGIRPPAPPTGTVTITPPAADRPTGGIAP